MGKNTNLILLQPYFLTDKTQPLYFNKTISKAHMLEEWALALAYYFC